MGADRSDYLFTLPFDVRDYECDMEGIVNNAIYQNYLEHARHQFLKSRGIDFAELTRRGVHPVVVRAEIDYKRPLRSGDTFWVGMNLEVVSRLRFAFVQDIYLEPGSEQVLAARIIAAAVSETGKPLRPEDIHPGMSEILTPTRPS